MDPRAPEIVDERVTRHRLVLLAIVVLVILAGLALYGLGSGGRFYFHDVRAPLRAAVDAPYHRASILHVGLAHLLGVGTLTGFRLFVLASWWATLVYLAWVAPRSLRWSDAALLLAALATLPAAMIVHAWTCHPDAPTLLLTALLLLVRRPGWLAPIAALGAWNHREMWLVICLDAALLWLAQAGPDARRKIVAVALGLLVGVLGHALLLHACGITIGEGRLAAAGGDPGVMLGYWTTPGWAVAYPLYFVHVLWLPALVLGLRARGRGLAAWLLASQLLALAATWFTRDTTRVFAILSWGPLMIGLMIALREGGKFHLRPLLALAIVATLVGPKYFAWEGRLHGLDGARAHLRALVGDR